MSFSSLRAALRRRPKTSGFAALSLVGASGCITAAYIEKEADVTLLPLVYDYEKIAAHWKERPWATLRRRFELTHLFVPFAIKTYLEWRAGELKEAEAQASCAAKFRAILQEGGPTFIKLGQALSSRPDLLPPVALRELQKLCDQCPNFDWRLACDVLTEGLAAAPEDVFVGAGPEAVPVSAASLGQVYKWEYKGRPVAVKVQRPDLRRQISLDLYLIRLLATAFQWIIRSYTNQRTDHVMLVDTWAGGTWSELDYKAEAANQQQFKDAIAATMPDCVYVPEVVWDVTSNKVIVSEWIDGPKLMACVPELRQQLIAVGIECFCLQLLELGIFHSDPHPGNLLVRDGKLVLIDFGLVAQIDRPDMNHLALGTVHLIRGDYDCLFDDAVALGFLQPDADRETIMSVVKPVLNLAVKAGSDVAQRLKTFQDVSDSLNQIFFEFPFEVPPYFALITRAIITLEGIALVSNERFDIFQATYPFFLKHAAKLLMKGDAAGSVGMATGALAMAAVAGGTMPVPDDFKDFEVPRTGTNL